MADTAIDHPTNDVAAAPPTLGADTSWFDRVVERLPSSPGWVVAALELLRRHAGTSAVIRGHGAGPHDDAMTAAIGELAERFVASDPRVHAALVRDSPGRGRVIPVSMAHPAARPMSPGWVLGIGTVTGAHVWLPAGAVLLGWQQDPPFVDATGLAAGATWDVATARATDEVRERDAVGRWWRSSLQGTSVAVPAAIVAALSANDLTGRVVRVDTTEAVVACVSGPGAGATVGSAWGGRVDHAIAEALMIRGTVIEHLRTAYTPAGLSDGLERILWGWNHADRVFARFMAGRDMNVCPPDEAEPIAVRLGRLAPTPLGSLAVVRVVIPGAYRLETLSGVRHPHPAAVPQNAGTPHPFG